MNELFAPTKSTPQKNRHSERSEESLFDPPASPLDIRHCSRLISQFLSGFL
jgi:hypothetical protein